MIARFGSLECGKNYKGTLNENCNICNCLDDENHRINLCKKLRDVNVFESDKKLNFDMIYSDNLEDIRTVTSQIMKIWNTCTAGGTMRN